MFKVSPEGVYLMEWCGHGAAPGQFDVPHGIAIDSEVFVGEVLDANRVQKFKPGCGILAQRSALEE